MRKTLRYLTFSVLSITLLLAHISLLLTFSFGPIVTHAMKAQRKTIQLLTKTEKTPSDYDYIQKSIATSRQQANKLSVLINRLPPITLFRPATLFADSVVEITSQIPELLGSKGETHFLLFFLNNYELRPGGGFIGSVGFITLKNYTVTKFEVQDVYEIDGQITQHNQPHFAVQKYLNQPNEYLRDSNFSPDFKDNVEKALSYLAMVPPYNKRYAGAVGITTSAFEDLLRITGPIELSDYQITITASNFFTTTQEKIETTFFPGSKQKRSFLTALGNAVRQKIEEIPPLDLLWFTQRSVINKNLVLFSSDLKIQNVLMEIQASGDRRSRFSNWILPIDANVGVNKLNRVVHKTMGIEVVQTPDAIVQTFRSQYFNPPTQKDNRPEIFKNYFQLYAPSSSKMLKVWLNGREATKEVVTTYSSNRSIYALYFETPPATNTEISIEYKLPRTTFSDTIEIKKQIGSEPSFISVAYSDGGTKVMKRRLFSDEIFTLR